MQQHALVAAHKFFLSRHLIFCLFICILSSATVVYEIATGLWNRFFKGRVESCRSVRPGNETEMSCASQ